MKIAILLPYKENFSKDYAGAVSIYIKDTVKISKYKKKIIIYGSTKLKNILLKNYVNLIFEKKFFQSGSNLYLKKFLEKEKKIKSDIIEVHNRPNYIKSLIELDYTKLILYFHNDPLKMQGSKTINERLFLLNNLKYLVFNSNWSKNRFIKKLNLTTRQKNQLIVIRQSVDPKKINLEKKKKIITFVGKLNKAKGYDIFGEGVCKILDKYPDWTSIVVGDEPREKLNFNHRNFKQLGFLSHDKVLKIYEKTSIAVVCSRWDEPFGRTSLEAASRGCATIISNKGGLPETITDGIILNKLTSNFLYNKIKKLINDDKLRRKLQSNSLKNFKLTNKFISKKIDDYRSSLITNYIKNNNSLKILHVTNFNERHDGRLFYNTSRRINNGLVRLNHSVLTLSDRDIVSRSRSITDISGSKVLNIRLIETIKNYNPDLLILGHADLIKRSTLIKIKKEFSHLKIAQWFLDRMDDNWRFNKKRFLHKMDLVNANFCTTDPKILKFSNKQKVFYIPNPSDISFENLAIYKNKNFTNDVFFALSHGVHRGILKKGKFDEREKFIKKLISITPNIKFDIYGMDGIQPIWAEKFKEKLSESKMGINLSQGKPLKHYSSDRIAQLVGNGILTFIDEKTKFHDFFNSNEVVYYKNVYDLSKKIKYFVNKDKIRSRIAKHGQIKYNKFFNSKLVAEYIISKTLNIKSNKKFIWDLNSNK